MSDSAIEWTDVTWNPVVGCTQVSPGCAHCYAKTLHEMRHRAYQAGKLQNIPQYAKPFGEVQLLPDRLADPLRWRKPRRVFVNSMADLFHEDVPDEFIDLVFGIMAAAPQHTFQILTKRPSRMRAWFSRAESHLHNWPAWVQWHAAANEYFCGVPLAEGQRRGSLAWDRALHVARELPLPNVWLGVSVENQRFADERIPLLLQTPAAVRFLSCEPLLGPVDILESIRVLHREVGDFNPVFETRGGIDWVIAGAESGRGARPMDISWVREIKNACVDAGVPFFFKQSIENGRVISLPELDGGQWTQFPSAPVHA